MLDIKEKLIKIIQNFADNDLLSQSSAFFEALGYVSSKRNAHENGLPEIFLEYYDGQQRFNPERGLFAEWQKIYLLFQLTDDEIKPLKPTFQVTAQQIDNAIIESFLFIALALKKSHYSRTDLAKITRAVNQIFDMSAIVLFKYSNQLTLSAIQRRLHKKDDTKDVLEKVTLIKDIDIAAPHRAQMNILEQLSLSALNVSNFVELHRKWQEVLDISVLNKQFYQELAVLFTQLVGGERGKTKFATTLKLPSIADDKVLKEFAVRLIGRLLFCWFLQKKTSNTGKSLVPTEILSSLALQQTRTVDFYHEKLEPLFFEVLNKELKERKPEFQQGLWAQIPFLNGGLFEPHVHDFYDENCTLNTLVVPDIWLKDLLGFFERYHFTIEENTPLDVQVAIDPEMLGQIFENLLAEINPETGETARKATGSYYTPREIVDYMVDESLVAYFSNLSGFENLVGLRALLSYASSENPFNAEESQQLLSAIEKIKILDPACGSGAFPMGILQKLMLMLQRLDPDCSQWLANLLKNIPDLTARQLMQEKLQGEQGLWDYTRKLGILRECIYGVDIQPIALEISRLRCFLSLMVDEKIEENKPNLGIMPLPNLAFKFVCANTLKGISQLDWQLYEQQTRDFVKQLAQLRAAYLISQGAKKAQLQAEFTEVQKKMLDVVLQWAGKDSAASQLATWRPFSDESCDWFDALWMFGVTPPSPPLAREETGGFDVVLGNPPYVRQEAIKHLKTSLKNYQVFTGTSDLFTYFYESGFNLLKENGILAFITSNKWMRAKYGEKLREFFLEKTTLLQLIDFKGKQVFDATVDANILLFKKGSDKSAKLWVGEDLPSAEKPLQSLAQSCLNKKVFMLGDERIHALKAKIEAKGTPLKEWDVKINYGIKTGFNEAFIIDTATKERLCAEDPKSAEIIKPVLRGRDIKRYGYQWAGLWLINSHNNPPVNIDDYPAIKKHLDNYYLQLEKRLDKGVTPYNLRNCAYLREFEKEKVVWADLSRSGNSFVFDNKNLYLQNTGYIMTGLSLKYLNAVLNSKLILYYFNLTNQKLDETGWRWINQYVEQLPIPQISETAQKPFITLVDKILASKQPFDKLRAPPLDNSTGSLHGASQDTSELEREIDARVFDLYDLTEEEIAMVEGK